MLLRFRVALKALLESAGKPPADLFIRLDVRFPDLYL